MKTNDTYAYVNIWWALKVEVRTTFYGMHCSKWPIGWRLHVFTLLCLDFHRFLFCSNSLQYLRLIAARAATFSAPARNISTLVINTLNRNNNATTPKIRTHFRTALLWAWPSPWSVASTRVATRCHGFIDSWCIRHESDRRGRGRSKSGSNTQKSPLIFKWPHGNQSHCCAMRSTQEGEPVVGAQTNWQRSWGEYAATDL